MADERDLAEQNDDEPDVDNEPSLGWPERFAQSTVRHGSLDDEMLDGG
jgi:hypothetical protein